MIKVSDLDKRICDVEDCNCKNTGTYRQFIIQSEDMLGIPRAEVDKMSDSELTNHIQWLDDMWVK